jgi:hypothetical protein
MTKPVVNEKLMEILNHLAIRLCTYCEQEEKDTQIRQQAHDQIIELFREDKLLVACKEAFKYLDQPHKSELGNVEVINLLHNTITEAEKKIGGEI